jgi:hypothetical protein
MGSGAPGIRRVGARSRAEVFVICGLSLILAIGGVWGADPRIDHIELLGTNLVTIHIYTEANRTYSLQSSAAMTSETWSNLYVIPAEPFPNHYVLADYVTNAFRFYRLTVAP